MSTEFEKYIKEFTTTATDSKDRPWASIGNYALKDYGDRENQDPNLVLTYKTPMHVKLTALIEGAGKNNILYIPMPELSGLLKNRDALSDTPDNFYTRLANKIKELRSARDSTNLSKVIHKLAESEEVINNLIMLEKILGYIVTHETVDNDKEQLLANYTHYSSNLKNVLLREDFTALSSDESKDLLDKLDKHEETLTDKSKSSSLYSFVIGKLAGFGISDANLRKKYKENKVVRKESRTYYPVDKSKLVSKNNKKENKGRKSIRRGPYATKSAPDNDKRKGREKKGEPGFVPNPPPSYPPHKKS